MPKAAKRAAPTAAEHKKRPRDATSSGDNNGASSSLRTLRSRGGGSSGSGGSGSGGVPVAILRTFHGQCRLMVRGRPPMDGQPGFRDDWRSMLLTTAAQHESFAASIQAKSYSMNSAHTPAPISAPLKQAKPRWGQQAAHRDATRSACTCMRTVHPLRHMTSQALLVVVSRAPFVRHRLTIVRRCATRYTAHADLLEDRKLASPHAQQGHRS